MNSDFSAPKVSVIVPVYDVEQYLSRCLSSICLQTEKNIEIIIVNDASPDNSQSIIDQYAEDDPRVISIIHNQNKGAGAARNTGIEKSLAPWLMFVDSDDYLPHNALAVFLQKTEEYPEVKLFTAGTTRVAKDGTLWDFDEIPPEEILLHDPFYNYCFQHDPTVKILTLSHSPCTKLFHRDIFLDGNLRFPAKTIMEDFALGLPLFDKLGGSVLFLSARLYFYVEREGSTLYSYDKQKIKEFAQVLQNLSAYTTGLPEQKRSWAKHRIYSEFLLWMQWLCHAYGPDFGSYLLLRSPEHCVTRFLEDKQARFVQLQQNQYQLQQNQYQLQQDRWYRFGQLSRKLKLWAIVKILSKRLGIYRFLQPLPEVVKRILGR